MTAQKLRVVHYLNQFFGQIGGEDKADSEFIVRDGPVGPGMALQKELGGNAEIVATVICGDNHFSRDPQMAAEAGVKIIESYRPDLFFAGPAFEAGRYGVSCGAMCKAVGEKLSIPAITGMYYENPGMEMYHKSAFICKTGNSTRSMGDSLKKMANLGLKLVSGKAGTHLVCRESLPSPSECDYFPRHVVRNEYCEKSAAERSIDKLLAKLKGEPFESEVIPPKFEKIDPPPAIKDMSKCLLAIVSDGGLVPKGNPDGMSGRGNLKWATYDLDKFLPDKYNSADYEIAHTGYYSVDVLANPNRLIPVDILREFEAQNKIGKLHNTFFSTSGNATVARRCLAMGDEMAQELKSSGVDAVLLTST